MSGRRRSLGRAGRTAGYRRADISPEVLCPRFDYYAYIYRLRLSDTSAIYVKCKATIAHVSITGCGGARWPPPFCSCSIFFRLSTPIDILFALFSSGGRCGSAPNFSALSLAFNDEAGELRPSADGSGFAGLISAAHLGGSLSKLKGLLSNRPPNLLSDLPFPLELTDDARLGFLLPPNRLNLRPLTKLFSSISSSD